MDDYTKDIFLYLDNKISNLYNRIDSYKNYVSLEGVPVPDSCHTLSHLVIEYIQLVTIRRDLSSLYNSHKED